MRILIAEDQKDLNKILTKKLTAEGYNVDSCFDGQEALDYLRAADYDGVILDVNMPRLDGFGVVKAMRASGSQAPVLFLTARDSIEDKVTGLDLGASDYLVKPFSPRELVARARALLRRPRFLMMDEPFASLDAMTRGDLQIMLKELVDEQGMACLFVTHDMDEAFVVARRVVVMRGGRAAATFEAEEFSGWERRERVRDHILTCLGRKQGA